MWPCTAQHKWPCSHKGCYKGRCGPALHGTSLQPLIGLTRVCSCDQIPSHWWSVLIAARPPLSWFMHRHATQTRTKETVRSKQAAPVKTARHSALSPAATWNKTRVHSAPNPAPNGDETQRETLAFSRQHASMKTKEPQASEGRGRGRRTVT